MAQNQQERDGIVRALDLPKETYTGLRQGVALLLACMILMAVTTAAETVTAAGTGTISGRFLDADGERLSGGTVFFFNTAAPPPSQEEYWRVPDFLRPLDAEGRFSVELPEGTYYLGALRRLSGGKIGPPREGDLFTVSTDDRGERRRYTVKRGQKLNVGTVARVTPFKPKKARDLPGVTVMEGIVLDQQGNPVGDVLVFASLSAGTAEKPVFASDATQHNGKFSLRVHDGGTFYLKARGRSGGGAPVAGEAMGIFGDTEQVPVRIRKGERLSGLTIRMGKFSPGRPGAQSQQRMEPLRPLPKRGM